VLYDTGSNEIWVPAHNCTDEMCYSRNKYKYSNTFKKFNEKFDIEYISGGVVGKSIKDDIYFDGHKIKNQVIGLAEQLEVPVLRQLTWDGIVGLGFMDDELLSKNITPLFENIVNSSVLKNKGKRNEFSVYIGRNQGTISVGNHNQNFFKYKDDNFLFAKISRDNM